METKKCNECGLIKTLNEFRKSYNKKLSKYYVRNYCIECERKKSRKNSKKYYHSKIGREKREKYLKANREEILKKSRIRTSIYRQTHKEEIKEKRKIYLQNNKEKINNYYKNKYQQDSLYRFKNTIRNMVRMSFKRKGKIKSKYLEEILGCDIDFLINYLIKTYENNYSEEWKEEYFSIVHIDHIKPLKYAQTQEEIEKLCHYKNLQLLKAEDNLKKQAKYIES